MNAFTFEQLFFTSLDRDLGSLSGLPSPQIAVGESGKKRTPNATALPSNWRFPDNMLPFFDESVGTIHAYHFIEHLSNDDAILFLREVERVLVPGGIFQFAIPLAGAEISFQDLTHKSFWTESTFATLFNNQYYSPAGEWKLRVRYQVIAGIVQRNLCLMGQLQKAKS